MTFFISHFFHNLHIPILSQVVTHSAYKKGKSLGSKQKTQSCMNKDQKLTLSDENNHNNEIKTNIQKSASSVSVCSFVDAITPARW